MKSQIALILFLTLQVGPLFAAELPHPVKNPVSPVMLVGVWAPEDHHRIDFDRLPRVPVEPVIVSRANPTNGVQQHNYLLHHEGRFWVMWSDGPGIEDHVGQVVKYSTSIDGSNWEPPQLLTPYPPNSGPDSPHFNTRKNEGLRYIARGFWMRDGQLLALASLDEAAGFFGPSLALQAFRWRADEKQWEHLGIVQHNASTISRRNACPAANGPCPGERTTTRRPACNFWSAV